MISKETLRTTDLTDFHQLLRAVFHDPVDQFFVSSAVQFLFFPVNPRKPLHDMEQDFFLSGCIPKRLYSLLLLTDDVQYGKLFFSISGDHCTGYIMFFRIQIKCKLYLRQKIGSELFRRSLCHIHHILKLRQDPVVKLRHMVSPHMERKGVFLCQICQWFNLFEEIFVHTAQFSSTDKISGVCP